MSFNEWTDHRMWYVHIMEYYSAFKRKEIKKKKEVNLVTYQMDELFRFHVKWNKPVTKKDKYCIISLTCGNLCSQTHKNTK
jgi:hypothetical protein